MRSFWYGIIPVTLCCYIHDDILQSIRILSKIITSCLLNLHDIWITTCEIIYKKLSDRIEIEKKVGLINNFRVILQNRNIDLLPHYYRNLESTQVDHLLCLELKGILFSYYSEIGNLVAYREMNLQSKCYLHKINTGISEEGFTIRERLFARENSLNTQRNEEENL